MALVLFGRLVVKPFAKTLQSPPSDPVAERIAALEARLVASGAIPDEAAALQAGSGEAPAISAAPGMGVGAANQQDQSLQAIRSWLRES